MGIKVLQIIGLILFSSVKFLFAPSTVYVVGFSFFETLIITISGGVFGVLLFFYSGTFVINWWNQLFPPKNVRKNFSKKNRTIIRVKNSYGLFGLAFISPCLISIPIGCLIAAKYFRYDKRTVPVFIGAVVFWAIVLTSLTASIGPLFD